MSEEANVGLADEAIACQEEKKSSQEKRKVL